MEEGLFGGRHRGHRNEYSEEEAYVSEIGGGFGGERPRPEAVYEGGDEVNAYASETGGGYGRPPPPVVYEGGGYGGGGYPEEGYGRRPAAMYDTPDSDLGTGLSTEPGYGAGYGAGEYEEPRHHGNRSESEEERYEEERKHNRHAEEAAAVAIGYGLHERRERKDDEERLEELGYDDVDGRKKHEHHLFRLDE